MNSICLASGQAFGLRSITNTAQSNEAQNGFEKRSLCLQRGIIRELRPGRSFMRVCSADRGAVRPDKAVAATVWTAVELCFQ